MYSTPEKRHCILSTTQQWSEIVLSQTVADLAHEVHALALRQTVIVIDDSFEQLAALDTATRTTVVTLVGIGECGETCDVRLTVP